MIRLAVLVLLATAALAQTPVKPEDQGFAPDESFIPEKRERPAAPPTPPRAAEEKPAPASAPPAGAAAPIAIEIDLSGQRAWILQDGQRVYETPISSGRSGFPTPVGNFRVTEKDHDHKSSLYGKIVDAKGRVVIADGDSDMPVPPGGRFVAAPMPHFMRFNGAVGMHAGRLPGYPASHGCVRLPPAKAKLFFEIAEVGTPVRVFGQAPRTSRPPRPGDKKSPGETPAPGATPRPGWFARLFVKPAPTPARR
jgi:lipoprotein-anchoring transpeptidase ErfK/SrfK